jgi:hypothetical protein
MPAAGLTDSAVELAPGVHWVGALDPHLRNFDIILKTANGTSYNSYVVRWERVLPFPYNRLWRKPPSAPIATA